MVGKTIVIVVAGALTLVFLFLAASVCLTSSAWTIQTRALIALPCCIAAASCIPIASRLLRPSAPQRIASPFLLLFRGLAAAQHARRAAILLTWCIAALSLWITFFTQLPHIVAVLTFFGSLAPYIASIKVIEPWLLRRSGPSSR